MHNNNPKITDVHKLSNPAKNALDLAGIIYLNDFERITEKEFKNLHGIGPATVKPIKKILKEYNINFKSE